MKPMQCTAMQCRIPTKDGAKRALSLLFALSTVYWNKSAYLYYKFKSSFKNHLWKNVYIFAILYPSNTNSITGIVLTYLQSRVTLGHAKNGGVGNFPLLAEKDLDNFAVLKHILFRTLTRKERVERKWKWKLIFFLSFFLSGSSLFPEFFFLVRPYVRDCKTMLGQILLQPWI